MAPDPGPSKVNGGLPYCDNAACNSTLEDFFSLDGGFFRSMGDFAQ